MGAHAKRQRHSSVTHLGRQFFALAIGAVLLTGSRLRAQQSDGAAVISTKVCSWLFSPHSLSAFQLPKDEVKACGLRRKGKKKCLVVLRSTRN